MSRKAIEKETYRTLFAKTGNRCAFPGCNHPLIDEDNEFVAQICHIEAANEGGARYKKDMTDDERRSESNLLVLCYQHHIKTNNVEVYTAESLKKMKADHEARYSESAYHLTEEAIARIQEQEFEFWLSLISANLKAIEEFDLTMKIEDGSNPVKNLEWIFESLEIVEKNIDHIGEFLDNLPNDMISYLKSIGVDTTPLEDVPYYQNPFYNAFWEMMNIGFPNFFSKVDSNLKLVLAFLLFQELKSAPHDKALRHKLESLQKELRHIAEHQAHVD